MSWQNGVPAKVILALSLALWLLAAYLLRGVAL